MPAFRNNVEQVGFFRNGMYHSGFFNNRLLFAENIGRNARQIPTGTNAGIWRFPVVAGNRIHFHSGNVQGTAQTLRWNATNDTGTLQGIGGLLQGNQNNSSISLSLVPTRVIGDNIYYGTMRFNAVTGDTAHLNASIAGINVAIVGNNAFIFNVNGWGTRQVTITAQRFNFVTNDTPTNVSTHTINSAEGGNNNLLIEMRHLIVQGNFIYCCIGTFNLTGGTDRQVRVLRFNHTNNTWTMFTGPVIWNVATNGFRTGLLQGNNIWWSGAGPAVVFNTSSNTMQLIEVRRDQWQSGYPHMIGHVGNFIYFLIDRGSSTSAPSSIARVHISTFVVEDFPLGTKAAVNAMFPGRFVPDTRTLLFNNRIFLFNGGSVPWGGTNEVNTRHRARIFEFNLTTNELVPIGTSSAMWAGPVVGANNALYWGSGNTTATVINRIQL